MVLVISLCLGYFYLISGAVPGSEGGEVIVRPSVKAARLGQRKSITPNKKAEAKGKK